MPGALDKLYQMKNCKSKRVSSYDRNGGNQDFVRIAPQATAVLADIKGTGIIRHIWVTIATDDKMIRRNAVLRMYWNGEEYPSVEAPIGDFFGQGFGDNYNFISLPLAAAPSEGRALNSYWPMPFLDGARIEIENQSDLPINSFYCYVDYEEHESLPSDTAMFHAHWRREITQPDTVLEENEWGILGPDEMNTTDKNNYLFADIEGKGHFVGVNYYVDSPSVMWYGEGDDMWLIDGEKWPGSLHGTGTEDFFNSSWCPNEVYNHPYFGYGKVPSKMGWMGRTHMYRFLVEDPIYFEKSLRASIEHGHANSLILDCASVAYWYQTEPHKPYEALLPKEKRQNMPEIGIRDIHRWRTTWRSQKKDTRFWGNEE
jgi:Protein of unknown function (DUF2961).